MRDGGAEMGNNEEIYGAFRKQIIVWGRGTLFAAIVLAFAPPVYLWLAHGLFPGWGNILAGWRGLANAWTISWIFEPMTYFPILGLSGTFVSWLAGNIMNLRIPCSVAAQQAVGVEEGTPEGDVISTLGLTASVVVNIVILIFAAAVGVQVLALLPAGIKASFDFTLPAIIGAMIGSFATRMWKVVAIGVFLTVIVCLLRVPAAWEMLAVLIPSVSLVLFLYSKKVL